MGKPKCSRVLVEHMRKSLAVHHLHTSVSSPCGRFSCARNCFDQPTAILFLARIFQSRVFEIADHCAPIPVELQAVPHTATWLLAACPRINRNNGPATSVPIRIFHASSDVGIVAEVWDALFIHDHRMPFTCLRFVVDGHRVPLAISKFCMAYMEVVCVLCCPFLVPSYMRNSYRRDANRAVIRDRTAAGGHLLFDPIVAFGI